MLGRVQVMQHGDEHTPAGTLLKHVSEDKIINIFLLVGGRCEFSVTQLLHCGFIHTGAFGCCRRHGIQTETSSVRSQIKQSLNCDTEVPEEVTDVVSVQLMTLKEDPENETLHHS